MDLFPPQAELPSCPACSLSQIPRSLPVPLPQPFPGRGAVAENTAPSGEAVDAVGTLGTVGNGQGFSAISRQEACLTVASAWGRRVTFRRLSPSCVCHQPSAPCALR